MRYPNSPALGERTTPIFLSEREIAGYSLFAALDAARRGDWSGAGREREISVAIYRTTGDQEHSPHCFRVPAAILAPTPRARRDLTVGVASGGGYLAPSEINGVLDALRPTMVTQRLGAATMTGLRGAGSLVRQGGTSTWTWASTEGTQAAETTNYALGQIALSPKNGAAYVEVSRLAQLMAPDLLEALVRNDLRRTAATALDAAALNGTGTSDPLGVLNVAGIGTFTGASITYAGLLEAQTDILTANALSDGGEVAFACRAAVASLLANRQGFSTLAPMWSGPLADGRLTGCPAISSQSVPASTLLAGDFAKLLLVEWGNSLEIRVNPAAAFPSAIIGYGAFLSVDVAVLQPSAFSVATGVT